MNLMNEGVLPPNELDDRDERREGSEAQDIKTTEDVIAWLRKPREGENAYLTLWRDEIADRIEAAHRRERGNAAKLREALCEILSYIETFHKYITPDKGEGLTALFAVADTIRGKARAALSAPPRNCDVYTSDELKVIFNSELASELPVANEHEKNLVAITAMEVIDTLLAPATEKEGGNDAD